MRSPLRRAALAVALAATFLLPTVAFAAPPADNEIDVQLWPAADPARAVVIIGEHLSATTKLPALVRLPVADGMTVTWAGEISADGQSDAERPYKIVDGPKGRYAELEVTNSRDVQIELGGAPLSIKGDVSSTKLSFKQSVPSSLTAFSVRIPPAATHVRIQPAPARKPAKNSDGESLYTLPSKSLGLGDVEEISVSYSTVSGQPQPAQSQGSAFLPMLVAALVAAVVALLIALAMRKKPSQIMEEDEELPQNAS